MKSLAVLIGTRGASAVAQMFLVFFLAASVNAAEFGLVMAVFAGLSVVAALSDFGLGTFTLRAAARGEIESAVSSAKLSTKLCVVVGAAALLLLCSLGLSETIFFSLVPLCIWAMAERNTETRNMLQLALGDVKRVGLLVALRRVMSVPLMLLLSSVTSATLSFTMALCVTSLAAWILSLYWTRRWTAGIAAAPLRLVWEQKAFAVTGVSGQIRNLDITLVSLFAGAAAAGVYGLGVRLGAPLLIVYNAASNLLMADFQRASGKRERRTRTAAWAISLLIAGLGPAVASISAPILLGIIEWLGEGDLLTVGVLMSMTSFVGLGIVLGSVLVSADQERYVAVNGFIWALTTLGLVILFAFALGPLAAAIAAVAGYLAKCLVLQARISTIRKNRG